MKSSVRQELGLEELKKLQLDILSEVDGFCKKNGVHYSLAYGTLLGAVRHKGFIPWDDDIDIWMPRKDYEYFMKNFHNERYYVVCEYKEIPLPYGKVCDRATQLIENANYSFSPGVFIDVFPVDYLPLNVSRLKKTKKEICQLYRLKFAKEIKLRASRNFIKNTILGVFKVMATVIGYKRILKRLYKLMTTIGIEDAEYMTDYNEYEKDVIFPLNSFSSLIELTFENKMFSCVSCYDAVLRYSYGDYLVLPPEDKRVTHHSYKATMIQ